MTGPPYPRPVPAPGSNAIGSFVIGQSPIGDIPPFDPWVTVISQYANSPIMTGMFVTNMGAYLDETFNLDEFFDDIWNILSATGYGLDVWGRILGFSRTVHVPVEAQYWGFAEADDVNFTGFNQAPYYSGQTTTSNFDLSDTAYRTVLLIKAATNITDGSAAAINQLLLNLFPGRGNCYVRDNLDMSMTYVFNFALSPVEQTIVQLAGLFPKPAGVSVDVEIVI